MRSLMLAGGGLKIAYQAGCLQVLLDEAKLAFDHVDGASGGCLNAAMVANKMTGTQIADTWRTLNPFDIMGFNFKEYTKLFWARSIGTLDNLRTKVFPFWGLDWERIRAGTHPVVTFSIYDFSQKRLLVLENTEMDADLLCAAVALPMWFPPVIKEGRILFDAVYCTDANVGEGVRRGADEMWAIWTVADLPEYRDGFLAQYFHIIETSADTRFFRDWEEIEAVNAAIARFGPDTSRPTPDLQLRDGFAADPAMLPPPGRKKIDLHLIKQEVPLHYLIDLSRDRVAEAVEMGVRDARDYCRRLGLLPPAAPDPLPTRPVTQAAVGVEFTETMRGFFALGADEPEAGEKLGRAAGDALSVRLTIHADDLERLIRFPEHEARATGYVEAARLGGRMDVTHGRFNLFVNEQKRGEDEPFHKEMRYSLRFRGRDNTPYLLEGAKRIYDDPGHDVWADTTTLFAHLYTVENDDKQRIGAGVVRIHLLDFMEQLTTFRVHNAPDAVESLHALNRSGQFFLGQLWDVYARHVIDYAPF